MRAIRGGYRRGAEGLTRGGTRRLTRVTGCLTRITRSPELPLAYWRRHLRLGRHLRRRHLRRCKVRRRRGRLRPIGLGAQCLVPVEALLAARDADRTVDGLIAL